MKRGAKWLIGIIGAVLVLVVVAAVVVVTFDWNRAKPWVARHVTDALGRSIAIDGDLRVRWYRDSGLDGWRSWVPSPHVFANQVTVGNSAWARSAQFGKAETVEFDFDLLPLLTRTVSIQVMRFVNPDAALERSADGRENWTFTDVPSAWHCEIGRIAVDRAKFTFFDGAKNIDLAGQIDTLGESVAYDEQVTQQVRDARREVLAQIGPKSIRHFEELADKRAAAMRRSGSSSVPQRYAFTWSATGTFHKAAFKGTGKLGGVFYLRNPERPFPLLGDMHIGDTHIVLVGTLTDPADLDAINLRLWLAGPNLSHLYDIAGLPLPSSPKYAMEGHLAGNFTHTRVELTYQDFTARIGQSDLSGTLQFRSGEPRGLLSGKVESDELQFRDLAPLIGADTPAAKTSDKPGSAKVLPEEPFRPERWRVMDADVEFTGDHVFRDSELPIHKVDTHVVMKAGVLALAPLKFRYAHGDVYANLRFDGSAAPIKATFELSARGMQLKNLIPGSEGKDVSLGRADGQARLDASGQSVGALLGAANGELKLTLDSGTISKGLLETIGLNVPNIVVTKLFGDKQVKIDCAAADLVAKAGVFDARTFIIDTDVERIEVTGTIDLGRESVDLVVHPNSKGVRLLSLHSPIHVRGPFAKVDVSIDKGALLARAASAIGLAAVAAPAALVPLTSANIGDSGNRCSGLFQQVAKAAPPSGKKAPSRE